MKQGEKWFQQVRRGWPREAAAPSSGATSAGAAKPRADPSDPDLGPKVFPSTSARSASPRKEARVGALPT